MATATASPERKIKAPHVKTQPMLIGGKWVESVSGKTFPTQNPATGETICQVAEGDKADIDLAVKAARKAFDEGPWPRMSASERTRAARMKRRSFGAALSNGGRETGASARARRSTGARAAGW